MKNSVFGIAGLFGILVAAAGISHAATFDLGNGGELCEGPTQLLPFPECNGVTTFGDGPQTGEGTPDTINLTFSGSGHATIYGGIRGQNASEFQDLFNLTGSGQYLFTLRALEFRGDEDFDADWDLGGTDVGTLVNKAGTAEDVEELSTLVTLSAAPTLTLFTLDAAGGIANGSVMEYELKIQAVPLPAGVVLLLSGLGGLALARRKTRA